MPLAVEHPSIEVDRQLISDDSVLMKTRQLLHRPLMAHFLVQWYGSGSRDWHSVLVSKAYRKGEIAVLE